MKRLTRPKIITCLLLPPVALWALSLISCRTTMKAGESGLSDHNAPPATVTIDDEKKQSYLNVYNSFSNPNTDMNSATIRQFWIKSIAIHSELTLMLQGYQKVGNQEYLTSSMIDTVRDIEVLNNKLQGLEKELNDSIHADILKFVNAGIARDARDIAVSILGWQKAAPNEGGGASGVRGDDLRFCESPIPKELSKFKVVSELPPPLGSGRRNRDRNEEIDQLCAGFVNTFTKFLRNNPTIRIALQYGGIDRNQPAKVVVVAAGVPSYSQEENKLIVPWNVDSIDTELKGEFSNIPTLCGDVTEFDFCQITSDTTAEHWRLVPERQPQEWEGKEVELCGTGGLTLANQSLLTGNIETLVDPSKNSAFGAKFVDGKISELWLSDAGREVEEVPPRGSCKLNVLDVDWRLSFSIPNRALLKHSYWRLSRTNIYPQCGITKDGQASRARLPGVCHRHVDLSKP